jgi:hypothetical protein
MYARSVTVASVGRADNARPCVPRRRFRASVTRRESAERPRDDSLRPSAESDLDMVNRCAVCQDAASDGASIDGTLRDANGRRWPAGPARTLVSTDATTVAKSARADGQLGEGADPNERVRLIDCAAQESRAGGLFGSTMLTGAQRPAGRRHSPPVGWPATAPTSTIVVGHNCCWTRYWRGTAQNNLESPGRRFSAGEPWPDKTPRPKSDLSPQNSHKIPRGSPAKTPWIRRPWRSYRPRRNRIRRVSQANTSRPPNSTGVATRSR